MIMVIIAFLLIFLYELNYLRSKKRKKRTYWLVFIVMGVSFLYCMLAVGFDNILSPNKLIQYFFQPIQKKIMG
jgi:4-amino-4-deoxy-L-arabinose transferase-like glycosyltransferase